MIRIMFSESDYKRDQFKNKSSANSNNPKFNVEDKLLEYNEKFKEYFKDDSYDDVGIINAWDGLRYKYLLVDDIIKLFVNYRVHNSGEARYDYFLRLDFDSIEDVKSFIEDSYNTDLLERLIEFNVEMCDGWKSAIHVSINELNKYIDKYEVSDIIKELKKIIKPEKNKDNGLKSLFPNLSGYCSDDELEMLSQLPEEYYEYIEEFEPRIGSGYRLTLYFPGDDDYTYAYGWNAEELIDSLQEQGK